MRVGIVGIQHESNTFIARPTDFSHFAGDWFARGEDVRARYAASHHEAAGFLRGLADAGMRRPLLSQIETGRVMPTLEEVRSIARAMSRTEEEILEVLKRQGSHLWQKERKIYVRRTTKPAA